MQPIATTARRLQTLPFAALALFFALPVLTIVAKFARVENLADTITNASLRSVWWFTTWQATLSTALTVALALPFTWVTSRRGFRFNRTATALITVPFLMPSVVVATGIRAMLPNAHVPAILWAHVAFNVAVIVRIVGPRWALLDSTLELTAADLGASPLRTFASVTFPHIRGALRNASALVFLYCFTSFATVAILGGISRRTIESEIFTQAVRLGNTGTATSLAILQAVVIVIVLSLGARNTNTDDSQTINPTTTAHPTFTNYAAIVVPLAIAVTPLIAVITKSFFFNNKFSFNGYKWLFNGAVESVGISATSTLLTSATFALACAILATSCALIIASARNQQSVINTMTALPLAVSAVTLGLGIIITFNQSPFNWRGDRWLIPVIHSVIALPLALRTITPAINAIPADLHEASASLGASPLRTWWKIDLPLLRPALTKAAGLCAAVSLGEFGATSFLSRSNSTTIPIAIGQLLGHPGTVMSQSAYALATVTIVAVSCII